MRLKFTIITLCLFVFMMTSLSLCFTVGLAMTPQAECEHSGSSVCSMNNEDCCLTELGEVQMKAAKRMIISDSDIKETDL